MDERQWIRFHTVDGPAWGEVQGNLAWQLTAAPYAGGTRIGTPSPLDSLRLIAPATPSKIVCVGRNYRDLAAERNDETPAAPMLFLKAPSSLIGPGEPILLPSATRRIEMETELAIMIGKQTRHATKEMAEGAILGYTIANDVSDRDLQRADGQFGRAKSFDTFCPLGPCIVPTVNPNDLAIAGECNGVVRQQSRTSNMIFSPLELVMFISSIMTLEPGDLILTGTPAGPAQLQPRDTVRLTIAGIGTLENPVALAD